MIKICVYTPVKYTERVPSTGHRASVAGEREGVTSG